MSVVHRRAIHVQFEIAVIGRQFHHLLAHNQLLAQPAMRDQTLDRTNAQLVLFLELHQFRQARHRPIVVQNFAKHAGRLQPRHPGEIDRCFGVTGAPQNAAFLRSQGEDMTRLDEILRHGLRFRDRADGRRAIMGADSRGHAFRRVDRDGKIGPIHFSILRDHPLQPELIGTFARDRRADQSPAVQGHEIDCLGRCLLRRHDQVAFVFPIGIVSHDHDFACRDVTQHVVNRVELKGFRRLDDHPNTIAVAPALGNGEFTTRF